MSPGRRDLAVLAIVQARSRAELAVKIYSAHITTDKHARVAVTLLDVIVPMLTALESLMDP